MHGIAFRGACTGGACSWVIPAALSQHCRLTKNLVPRSRERHTLLVPAENICI